MGTDRRQFYMVGIKDVRNYSSDYSALQARLLQCPVRCYIGYLQGRRSFPLSLPAPEDFRPTDRKFQELKSLEPTPPPLTRSPLPQWMLDTSTRMIDKRAALRRNPRHNRNVACKFTKAVRSSLLLDSRRRAKKATKEIGACLEPVPGNSALIGAYAVLKRW